MTGIGVPLLVVGGVASIVLRYRRSDTTVRSQIKWVFYGLGVMLAGLFGTGLIPEDTPVFVSDLMFVVALLVIPVAVVLAITRYRLYDIDRLVSRTVGYLTVLFLLGLVYVGGTVWLPRRLIGEQSSPIFVAVSTLAAAVLANPLRKRIMRLVDRRFNRSKFDAEQLVQQFGAQMGDRRELGGIIDDATSVITDVMQPVSIGIWIDRRTADAETYGSGT
ncbi:MAG: hypothetical protein R3246_01445 [Acidimicrobiia bacterium]|nr:hypothetical protein [Acidimicrobiia bacterium]